MICQSGGSLRCETELISISRSRTRATELDLNNVQDTLRTFILEYQSGSRDIKQLVSSESLKAREHILASSKETFQALGGIQKTLNSLTLEADVQVDQARRERLLQSLKFPGFNERRNQISEAHESTFNWIFVGDDGPSQEDSTESDLDDSDWEESDLEDVDLADPSEASWDLFSNWLSSTEGIYWISGKPGSGKTTLVKFLLEHPKTAACLEIWSPRALKISHFFWRPGNEMQQNIKGLLCSLLYQLVDNSGAATKYLFQLIQDRGSGAKDAHTDWSVPELRSIFLHILSSYEHSVLIVIDGLDEVQSANGPLELLDLLEQFSRCRNTKLCLASRPEPILKQRLSVYPHLRLQDLTRNDLDQYARDHIKLSSISGEEDVSNSSTIFGTPWNPIESIVDKAEGVFLWLVLAIRNINRGCIYGDTLAIIQQRIDDLPGDLTKLYTDMWSRACEESPAAYRQTAALYFRLILLKQGRYSFHALPRLSLLQLMLASTSIADQILDVIENPLNLVPEGKLLKECGELERRVDLYCFGLLTFTQETIEGIAGWYGSQYDGLWSRYGQRYPQFIHRTARDFLLDTAEGTDILSYEDSSESSLLSRWFKAQLATSQLYVATAPKRNAGPVSNFAEEWIEVLSYIYKHFGPGDPNWTQAIFHLERLCSSGQMFTRDNFLEPSVKLCGGLDFLKLAGSVCCHESIWPASKMRSLPTETFSEIFLNICIGGRVRFTPHRPVEDAINTLLHAGAEPNWRGTGFSPSEYLSQEYSEVLTPFTEYVGQAMRLTWGGWRGLEYRFVEVLKTLHAFLYRSAHLESMLVVAFWHKHNHDGCKFTYLPYNLNFACGMSNEPEADIMECVLVSLSAHTALQTWLDYVRKVFEHPRCREEERYDQVMPLIASIQKRLDNWSRPNDDCIIGRLVQRDSSKDTQEDYTRLGPVLVLPWQEPVLYVPSKKEPAGIADELVKELGCWTTVKHYSSIERCRIVSQLVQQMSWTVQAEGFDGIWASLAELGILARVDHRLHDIRHWVNEFQKQKSADGSFADGIKVAQCYIGSPRT